MAINIDLGQFLDTFFDEAEEHLSVMEHRLLSLSTNNADQDTLDSIFRAAHSIKGSAGIFGFNALTSLTHVMENLFDRLRSGKMSWNTSLAGPLLAATDVLKCLTLAYKEKIEPDLAACNHTCDELDALIEGQDISASHDESYGLFAESLVPSEEPYGFFDERPNEPADEEGYGFFESLSNDTAHTLTTNAPTKSIPPTTNLREVQAKTPISEATSIRVSVEKIDHIMNLVSELVITQSMLSQNMSERADSDQNAHQMEALNLLERNTRDLQEAVMSIRMTPIAVVFKRFPRVVHDVAQKLGKKVNLVIQGEHTELDKNLIEKLTDPLTHLVRNSVDHGIELPEQRLRRGKSATGTISLSAQERSGSIVVEVKDDGAGLNRERILSKARAQNMPIADDASDKEVWQLIFAPGFSTAEQVTDISGRGVGMDVVRRNIHELGGRIELVSVADVGTTTTIRLPLTLAILDGMIVTVGKVRYVIPLTFIIESLQPRAQDLRSITGSGEVICVREEYFPLLKLHQLMGVTPRHINANDGLVLLLDHEGRKIALLVDELVGQQQVVIKSLETNYRKIPNISAATIMGNGQVALILNIEQIVDLVHRKSA